MNTKPGITIGIPAYNEEHNIGVLLKNLLSQKRDNFHLAEIIVISDGSTDNTVQVVKSMKNSKIRLISGKKRAGQNVRLNQIIDLFNIKTGYLLILEADTLPEGKLFLHTLIDCVPKNGVFSLVVSSTIPTRPTNYFSKIVNYGYALKMELFKKAMSQPNLYLYTGSRLLSRKFLRTFRWRPDFHEDSYCYREAVKSGLPLILCKTAKINYKSVDNFRDYLLQSTKFRRAGDKESAFSSIYSLHLNLPVALRILAGNFIKHPVSFSVYGLLVFISFIYSKFTPAYSPLWSIYSSTKKLLN